jgi:transposase-like protein
MATKRSSEEIQRLLDDYQQSGMTRVEYCRQRGISTHALDYYRRQAAREAAPRLARVTLTPPRNASPCAFSLVLENGRRIESGWDFSDADLARLIRVAEAR